MSSGLLAQTAAAQSEADRTDSEEYTESRSDYWAARAAYEARKAATQARKEAGIKDDEEFDAGLGAEADFDLSAEIAGEVAEAAEVAAIPHVIAEGYPTAGQLAALRMCESTDNYGINTGNGYYGAYQFSAITWWWLGYSGYPHQAPPAVQDQAVRDLFAIYGWSPWPGCSRYLGFR